MIINFCPSSRKCSMHFTLKESRQESGQMKKNQLKLNNPYNVKYTTNNKQTTLNDIHSSDIWTSRMYYNSWTIVNRINNLKPDTIKTWSKKTSREENWLDLQVNITPMHYYMHKCQTISNQDKFSIWIKKIISYLNMNYTQIRAHGA